MKKETNICSSLGGDAIRLTASKIITLGITMLTTMMLSRFRTLEEYGTYSQMLLVINFVTSLLMLGLPGCINYFLARAETQDERRHFLSVYYTLSTMISLLIGGALVLAIPLIEMYFHNPLIRSFYYFLALFPLTHIIGASVENVLVVYKKTSFLMIYRFAYSFVILGTVVVVQLLNYGFKIYILSYVLVNLLCTIAVYMIVYVLSGGIRFSLDKRIIKAVFVFSVPLGLASVVGTLNTEIDKLLIGYLMDTEQMAIYTNAAKELPLSIVASSITAILLPQMTRMFKQGNTKAAIALWGSSIELALIIIALIVAGVFTYAEDAMTILYSAKYLPGVNVFRVYTLNLILRCTYFGIMLNASGDTKKVFWCSVFSLILNAILNPLLYWLLGMIGPAIATLFSMFIILLLQLVMTAKIVKIDFKDIFPWKKSGYILIVNIVFALIFGLIKIIVPLDNLIGSVMESIVLGGIWSTIYLFLMKKMLYESWHVLNN